MTNLQGTIWDFNGNGSTGTMTIGSVDSAGNLEVTVQFDGLDRIDPWSVVFDDGSKQITLVRQMPNNVTQTHIGFLGDNDPSKLIFGGSFTESDIPSDAPRTQFGWFTVLRGTLIP